MNENRETKKRGWGPAVLAAAVLLLLTAALVFAGLLFSDPGERGEGPEPLPENAAWTAAGCVLTGESFELTEGQLCTVLAAGLREHPVSWLDGEALRVETADNQRLTIYAPVTWNGMRFHVAAELEVARQAQDKRLSAAVTSVTVGRVPVPPAWVMDRLAGSLSDAVEAEGTTLRVSSELPLLLLGEERTLAALEVREAAVSSEGVALSFAVNADGTADLIEEGLDWLQAFLG